MSSLSDTFEKVKSMPNPIKGTFNRLFMMYFGLTVVLLVLAVLFIMAKQPKAGDPAPPSNGHSQWSTGGAGSLVTA